MISQSLLEKALGGPVESQVALGGRTSIRTGGTGDYWAVPINEQSLMQVMDWCAQSATPYYVLGTGTNVLAADEGVSGVIIHLPFSNTFLAEKKEPESQEFCQFTLGAGEPLARLVHLGTSHGCVGTEVLAGIPGTVGGAVRMNAGTREGKVADFCTEIGVCEPGRRRNLLAEELKFSYRSSQLPGAAIISWARFSLPRGDNPSVAKSQQAVSDAAQRRSQTQPLQWPNFGSVFKNPPGKTAGQLVEACGLKGERIGGAKISRLHANFIINRDHAKSIDVLRLMRRMQDAVLEKFEILLIPEVRFLGESDCSLAPKKMEAVERIKV